MKAFKMWIKSKGFFLKDEKVKDEHVGKKLWGVKDETSYKING